jgi:pimeloyl-ACP methyl ester carboxylesterase
VEFKTGAVNANDIRFSYIESGEGELVLCLHGFPDHARSFRHQMSALSERGFRVVAPYMRGYSPTAIPENGHYQTAALGQDAVCLIEALGYESAIVLGHDWGATAAYAAAILAPEKVSKLITSAVPYGKALREAWLYDPVQQRRSWYVFFFQTRIAERAVANNNYEFIDKLWEDWSSPGWTCPPEEMAALKSTLSKPGVLSAALGYYRSIFDTTLHSAELESLQRKIGKELIHVPTLYIHGGEDGCIGPEVGGGMETYFPGGLRKHIIASAGHFAHQENPEEFNRSLFDFLEIED